MYVEVDGEEGEEEEKEMSVVVGWLSERSGFVKRHKRKFEFVLEMSWWVLLWVLMLSHASLLSAECPVLWDEEMQTAFCMEKFNDSIQLFPQFELP